MKSACILCVILACALHFPTQMVAQEKQKKITLTGFVRDADGKPVKDAIILIHIPSIKGKPISMTTDDSGKYQKEIDANDSFSLYYKHSDAGRAEVAGLSGNHNQNISIVMYTSKQVAQMSPEAVVTELVSYEHALFIAQFAEESELTFTLRDQIKQDEFMARMKLLGGLKFKNQKTTNYIISKQLRVQQLFQGKL